MPFIPIKSHHQTNFAYSNKKNKQIDLQKQQQQKHRGNEY